MVDASGIENANFVGYLYNGFSKLFRTTSYAYTTRVI